MSHVLDLGSRKFWQLTGRRVDLEGRERWLDAPVSREPRVGEDWLAPAWRGAHATDATDPWGADRASSPTREAVSA